MAQEVRPGVSADYEHTSRQLLRRLAETSQQMAAAEPGTDDFLNAYQESCRLREMYRQVRGSWQVPAELWDGHRAVAVDDALSSDVD